MTAWTAAHQASLSFTISWSYSNSCPLSRWCHPTISSSLSHFSCPQSFPASVSFPTSWLFASGGQSTGVSASASVLPMYIQGWFPLGLTGLIFWLAMGLSGVLSSTRIQKYQFFDTQPSFWSNSSVHDFWKNHSFWLCKVFDIENTFGNRKKTQSMNVPIHIKHLILINYWSV